MASQILLRMLANFAHLPLRLRCISTNISDNFVRLDSQIAPGLRVILANAREQNTTASPYRERSKSPRSSTFAAPFHPNGFPHARPTSESHCPPSGSKPDSRPVPPLRVVHQLLRRGEELGISTTVIGRNVSKIIVVHCTSCDNLVRRSKDRAQGL